METIDPDTLLKKVDKKGMSGDMFLSLLLHALLIGLTSFGLYASWMKWGVHTPGEIKRLEKEAAKAEAKKAAEAEAEAKAKAEAEQQVKADEKADADKVAKEAKAAQSAVSTVKVDQNEGAKASQKDEGPQQLPLDKQVEKPPKKDIDLDSLGLD